MVFASPGQTIVTRSGRRVVIDTADAPVSNWILATGTWSDSGVWDDTAAWID